jgi:hypothetical protein
MSTGLVAPGSPINPAGCSQFHPQVGRSDAVRRCSVGNRDQRHPSDALLADLPGDRLRHQQRLRGLSARAEVLIRPQHRGARLGPEPREHPARHRQVLRAAAPLADLGGEAVSDDVTRDPRCRRSDGRSAGRQQTRNEITRSADPYGRARRLPA